MNELENCYCRETVSDGRHGRRRMGLNCGEILRRLAAAPNDASLLHSLRPHLLHRHGDFLHQCQILQNHTLLLNLLIRFCGASGSLSSARSIFSLLSTPTQHSWNFLISAYARHGRPSAALQLFADMESASTLPNRFVFASVLFACANTEALPHGKHLHTRLLALGNDHDIAIGSAIINMYSKCGCLCDARHAFDDMAEHNVHSWTAMITAHANHGSAVDAIRLLHQMQEEGSMPSKVTYVSVLPVCSSERFLADGKRLHLGIVSNGYESDTYIATALIKMYANCGRLEEARSLFLGMCSTDEQSWNAIISGYALHEQSQAVYHLHNQMLSEGLIPNCFVLASIVSAYANPSYLTEGKRIHALCIGSEFMNDPFVRNTLVNMYGKCGGLLQAQCLFEEIQKPDKFLVTSMIGLLCEGGESGEAFHLFTRMQCDGVKPDRVTFSSILSACADVATVIQGKVIHSLITEDGINVDLSVGNALLNMYSKCGSLRDAENVFEKMGSRDTVTWNAMIATYAHHGHNERSLAFFHKMKEKGLSPNDVTFVSVLFACSHAGMVDEGCYYFIYMTKGQRIEPLEDHYNCLLDLLGRAGQLDEAENLISAMPMEASAISWMTLLSACKAESDLNRGIKYVNMLFQLEPESHMPYFMLADLCFRVGLVDEAAEVLKLLDADTEDIDDVYRVY